MMNEKMILRKNVQLQFAEFLVLLMRIPTKKICDYLYLNITIFYQAADRNIKWLLGNTELNQF